MESEEAILENENNCNVESESNTRDRDYCTSSPVPDTHGSPGLSPKVAASHLGSGTDVSQVPDSHGTPCLPPADVADNEDEPDLGSGTDEILVSRGIDQTAGQVDRSYDNHYEAVEPAGSAPDSGLGGKDIQDYEDFLPEDEPSQQGAAGEGGGADQIQDGATESSDQILDNEDDSERRLEMGEVDNDESSQMDDDETSRMDDDADNGVAESNEMDFDDSMGVPPARGDGQVTELESTESNTPRSGVMDESAADFSAAGLKQSSSLGVDVQAGRFWEDDVDLLDVDSQGETAGLSGGTSSPAVVDDLTRQASHSDYNMTSKETSDVPDTETPTTKTAGFTGVDLNDATNVLEDKEDDDLSQFSQLHAAGVTGDVCDEDDADRSQPRSAPSPEEDADHIASSDSVADSKMSPQVNDSEDFTHDTENLDDILSLDDCLQETDRSLGDHSQDADGELDDHSQGADKALDDHSQGTDNAEGEDSLVSGTSVDLEGELGRGASNIAETDSISQEADSEHGNSNEFVSQFAENESVVGAGSVPASIVHGGHGEDNDDKVLGSEDAGQHVGQADESVLDCADNDGQDDDGGSPREEDYQYSNGAVECEDNGEGDGQEIDSAVKCEEPGEGDGQVNEGSLAKESNLEATAESVADVCVASNSSEPETRESLTGDEHTESDHSSELEHQETELQEGEEQEPESERIDHQKVEPEQISQDQESGHEDIIGQEIDYHRTEQQQKDHQVNDGQECEQNKAVEEKVDCEDGEVQEDDDGSVEEESRAVGDDTVHHVTAGEKMDVTKHVDKPAGSADSAAPCDDDSMDVDGSGIQDDVELPPLGPRSMDRELQQNSGHVEEGDECEEEEAQDDGDEEEELVEGGQRDRSKIDSVGSELGQEADDNDEGDMAELGDDDDIDEPVEGEQEDRSKTDSVGSEMGHEDILKTDNAISEVVQEDNSKTDNAVLEIEQEDSSKTDKIVSDMEQKGSTKKDKATSEVVQDDSLKTDNAAHEIEQDSLKKDNAISPDTLDSSNKDEAEAAEAPKIKSELKPFTDSDFTQAVSALSSSSGGDVTEEAGTASKAGDMDDDVVVIDDEGKVVPVKAEAGEVKVAENGLDVKATPDKHQHAAGTKKNLAAGQSAENNKTKSRPSRSKLQTCLVCQKICKCKYNIVRNGDTKHLCDDTCFQQFRKTPSVFLKGGEESKSAKPAKEKDPSLTRKESMPAVTRKESTPASARKESLPSSVRKESLPASRVETPLVPQINPYRTCAICQLMNVNTSQPFCNWKGLDFCGESCLGKFQASLNTSCSFCHAYIPIDMRATCCLKIGNDMRPFCKQRCYNEFKKKLRMCSFCQRDIAGVSGAFTTMVGTGGKFREFCSQACMKKLESRLHQFEILYVDKGNLKPEVTACCVCDRQAAIKCAARVQGKVSKLCSDICLSTFMYSSKLEMDKCDQCRFMRSQEEAQAHFVQYEGQVKSFCSDNCVSVFRKARSQVLQCDWCDSKKLNFDMIERLDVLENKCQMFCSLNCLSLFRVNQQARSSQPVPCDLCQKIAPAQYHLTMSDASVRNFCSCNCVMTFRSQFATKHTPSGPGLLGSSQLSPSTQLQHTPSTRGGRGRMHTRQAKHQTTVPVISNVVSLAHPVDEHSQTSALTAASPANLPGTLTPLGSVCPSADGKHQILIQAATPKSGKNKSLQCKPLAQTKATSCKPHSQTRETQTDEVPVKNVLIPVPVPVYVPMPTVMYTAPAPKLIAIPIPIPVPIFIPTTRKSANGILKAIQEIVERMPADPLEAELLMMAEAVASDKRPGDSDTDSEDDDFSVPVEDVLRPATQEDDSLMMRKREGGQGEEDMIQMALRMAEEMSGPIEDLETSVEPVAVSVEAPAVQHHETIQAYDSQVDDDYIPARSYPNRGAKRPSRGRTPTPRVKKPRSEKSYEDDSINSTPVPLPHSNEPPPDANYRLKFTYGVNAWQHWVLSKNSQIEKSRHITGGNRLRTFSTDILKCTVDELNYSLCMFIKEVRKPNGEEYSPDSIYYLCLGIQQYLYENGRIDNIFTDSYFEKFTDCLNEILKSLRPKVNNQGQMLCRIEEEHLWESKQLGAHSPFILLNTLIYFHTKHFILKSAQEHLALSFAQILKHWKKGVPIKGQGNAAGKNVSLRFYCLANGKKDGLAARRNKDGTPVYEVTENFDNPLRCPVKLYEFFLSKCPESIKNRNDIFYPVPERSCVPDSPVWYSTQSIDTHTMDKMLTRLLLVREIQEAHLHAQPVYL